MIIDGNQLQFGNADGQESMNLGTNPVARLFADAFVMLLSGQPRRAREDLQDAAHAEGGRRER